KGRGAGRGARAAGARPRPPACALDLTGARAPTYPEGVTDLDIGAFSANGPWEVDPDKLEWRRGLDRVRAATAASVPQLTRRRRLPPGMRVLRVGALLGRALGGWYLTDKRKGEHVSRAGLSRRLRQAFE